MTTLRGLEGVLNRYVETVKKRANVVKQKIAKEVLKELVYTTPVDTSKALSNWQVGLLRPIQVSSGPLYEGYHGSTEESSSQITYAVGQTIINVSRFGEPIFISNHADFDSGEPGLTVALDAGEIEYRDDQSRPNTNFVADAIAAGRALLPK